MSGTAGNAAASSSLPEDPWGSEDEFDQDDDPDYADPWGSEDEFDRDDDEPRVDWLAL